MKDKKDIHVLTKSEYYSSTEYPIFVEYAIKQQQSNWLFTDPAVANDQHSIMVSLPPADKHAIIYVLKLFVQYELALGSTFWSAIGNTMPRAEVHRMCSIFASMELGVHSPFYAEVNKLLGCDTKEFYLEYKNDPILVERMQFLESQCKLGKKASVFDILTTLATFAMIEGVVLYSSFALLKSFQANGHNKIPNIITGVDYVSVDEQIHLEGAAALFATLYQQAELTDDESIELYATIRVNATAVVDHEFRIIESIFQEGPVSSVTKIGLQHFAESRADLVLSYLGAKAIYKPKYNPIKKWFYKNLTAPTMVDFFARTATQYTRDWNETKLRWDSI